ncbi:protein of unknown function [Clostridium cavendishii DSM 21758]|uniref:Uncharacterized protein n=1 Tax=Clostridium cavendishii DSM 21758 TaxID=1121302 RepID=A0A1M6ESB8_9CLOT|nr:DUF4173 domain-containing protein [Clostridium cavendishii]SHI88260.1 protein of unknown function [Clostridium cavendishii DSM 21758]
MENTFCIFLVNGENFLAINREGRYSLPNLTFKGEKDCELEVKEWLASKFKINYKKLLVAKENISNSFENDVYRASKNVKSIFVEAEEIEFLNKKDQDGFMFLKFSEILNLDFFNVNNLKSTMESLINEGYNSFSVEEAKKYLEHRLGRRGYFKNYTKEVEELRIDNEAKVGKKISFILLSLLGGILFSYFFFDYAGISVIIYVGYLIGLFLIMCGIKNNSFFGYFLLFVTMLLALSYGIYTNPIFRLINVFIIPISLVTSFILFTYKDITLNLKNVSKVFVEFFIGKALNTSIKLPCFLKDIIIDNKQRSNSETKKSILFGILVSLPILVILTMFLIGADSMFSYHIRNITSSLRNISIDKILILKIISFILVSFYVFGLMWSFSYDFKVELNSKDKKVLNPVTVITILTLVSLLYIVFTKIQISYLYCNKTLPEGFTHASYARSGFFQLVALVFINVIAIVGLKLKTNVDIISNIGKVLNGLFTIITCLTFNMSFSALYKMNLYIDTFGYTRLRILVQVFTIFLIFILFLLLVFIWREINLFKPVIIIGSILYVGLNFFNIDAYIVDKNVNEKPKAEVDMNYLTELSLDSAVKMKKAVDNDKIPKDLYDKWYYSKNRDKNYWYEYNYFKSQVK